MEELTRAIRALSVQNAPSAQEHLHKQRVRSARLGGRSVRGGKL